MILSLAEERALLDKAHQLYREAKDLEIEANLVFETVRQSQYERSNGIVRGPGDGG